MKKSVNFNHSDNSILSSFDDYFFIKTSNGWKEVNDIQVFKGTSDPREITIEDVKHNDYYIQYEMIGNYLNYSEDFTTEDWDSENLIFSKDSFISFPYSNATKLIPTMNYSKHSLSHSWENTSKDYWCFSIYIMPNEIRNFELLISDSEERYGLKAVFSIVLNNRKKYEYKPKYLGTFGNVPDDELVWNPSDCCDSESMGDGSYRIYLSAKFKTTPRLTAKLRLLKNVDGNITDTFSNDNDTAGLFINSAMLSKGRIPINYVMTNGDSFLYMNFSKLFKANNLKTWYELNPYNTVWYGKDIPSNILGNVDDIYFINPIIELGKFPRFGTNPIYYGWSRKVNNEREIYYTEKQAPSINDKIYDSSDEEKGIITSIDDNKSITVKLNDNQSEITLNRDSFYDKRRFEDESLVFWNNEKNTYSYISEGKQVRNLEYEKSVYNPSLFVDAISFSTNLFNQTYSSSYASSFGQKQLGYNSGGHYSCWDYNKLRKYY